MQGYEAWRISFQSGEQAARAAYKEMERLKQQVVYEWNGDLIPSFQQGGNPHELHDVVTAERCQWLVDKVNQLLKDKLELTLLLEKHNVHVG